MPPARALFRLRTASCTVAARHGKTFACPKCSFRKRSVRKSASHLKLACDVPDEPALDEQDLQALEDVCRAFREATGWPLTYSPDNRSQNNFNLMWSAPADPGVGNSLGLFRIFDCSRGGQMPRTELEPACELAGAAARLWAELVATRRALRSREAELAAGIPLVTHRDEIGQLAARLEGVLRAGAEAVDCQAAGLYVLDEGTSQLKLRASWGLPLRRMLEAPRPLAAAVADVEALLGHAVVVGGDRCPTVWNAPESFVSSVCLPVASATVPLGTVWFFCDAARDFTDRQTELLEVCSGRLAAELEREVLLVELKKLRKARSAVVLPENRPAPAVSTAVNIAPQIAGWKISGGRRTYGGVGTGFCDWFERAGGSLVVAAAQACGAGTAGALVSAAAHAALRARAPLPGSSGALLETVDRVLWTNSAGDDACGIVCAELRPATGRVKLSAAGPIVAIAVSQSTDRLLSGPTEPLGRSGGHQPAWVTHAIEPGEVVVLLGSAILGRMAKDSAPIESESLSDEAERPRLSDLQSAVAEAIRKHRGETADRLASAVLSAMAAFTAPRTADAVAVVLERR